MSIRQVEQYCNVRTCISIPMQSTALPVMISAHSLHLGSLSSPMYTHGGIWHLVSRVQWGTQRSKEHGLCTRIAWGCPVLAETKPVLSGLVLAGSQFTPSLMSRCWVEVVHCSVQVASFWQITALATTPFEEAGTETCSGMWLAVMSGEVLLGKRHKVRAEVKWVSVSISNPASYTNILPGSIPSV